MDTLNKCDWIKNRISFYQANKKIEFQADDDLKTIINGDFPGAASLTIKPFADVQSELNKHLPEYAFGIKDDISFKGVSTRTWRNLDLKTTTVLINNRLYYIYEGKEGNDVVLSGYARYYVNRNNKKDKYLSIPKGELSADYTIFQFPKGPTTELKAMGCANVKADTEYTPSTLVEPCAPVKTNLAEIMQYDLEFYRIKEDDLLYQGYLMYTPFSTSYKLMTNDDATSEIKEIDVNFDKNDGSLGVYPLLILTLIAILLF